MKRCYFAYTWDNDKSNLPDLLGILKNKIETYTEGNIEVVYDKESFGTGENFEDKEELILLSDSIVIFFSPQYRERVEQKSKNQGVYREYEKIKEVKNRGIASIIPIIVSGDEKNAITREFEKNIAEIFDVEKIFTKSRNKQIKKKFIDSIEDLVGKIIKETNVAYKKRDFEFSSKEDMVGILFGESEANRKLPQKCMYKTDAYESVMSQRRRYIIGRKGSGKTTFFELLEKYDVDLFEKKFKVLRPIKAEEISMEYAYNIINSYDVDSLLFSLNDRLELFWEIYTYLCAIYIVCLEEEYFKVEDERKITFRQAGEVLKKEKLKCEKLDTLTSHKALFTSAIETFDSFMKNDILSYIKIKSFDASLVSNFNVNNVMENYFGKSLYTQLKLAIIRCKKKMLIALDGFDTVSDDFRKASIYKLNSEKQEERDEGQKRLDFEVIFFRSMFTVFERLRKAENGIMSKVSFCIIIPQDKLDQIKQVDRDFSKYNFTSLSWDAIDLLKMLVYRLEYIYDVENDEDSRYKERFEYIMKKYYGDIPLQIQIVPNDKDASMDLFQYLLRLSFWRPRDIIKYFYEIHLAHKNNPYKGTELPQDIIKGMLYKKADDIIETEFYAEYRNVITNLEDIMYQFRGRNIVISLEEMTDIMERQPFKTSMLRDFSNPINKIKMLYELSAIGIQVDKKMQQQENLESNLCFNYNEGLNPLYLLDNKMFEKGKINIVINPIFSRNLELKYCTRDVLERYGWDYFAKNHTRKSSIKRI